MEITRRLGREAWAAAVSAAQDCLLYRSPSPLLDDRLSGRR
jgi:hypothetical protein